jgi:hypothetical protein
MMVITNIDYSTITEKRLFESTWNTLLDAEVPNKIRKKTLLGQKKYFKVFLKDYKTCF